MAYPHLNTPTLDPGAGDIHLHLNAFPLPPSQPLTDHRPLPPHASHCGSARVDVPRRRARPRGPPMRVPPPPRLTWGDLQPRPRKPQRIIIFFLVGVGWLGHKQTTITYLFILYAAYRSIIDMRCVVSIFVPYLLGAGSVPRDRPMTEPQRCHAVPRLAMLVREPKRATVGDVDVSEACRDSTDYRLGGRVAGRCASYPGLI